jgi:hypothetical protein
MYALTRVSLGQLCRMITARLGFPSRPHRPLSCLYSRMLSGSVMCMINRTSGMSMPVPNTLVAANTGALPTRNASNVSLRTCSVNFLWNGSHGNGATSTIALIRSMSLYMITAFPTASMTGCTNSTNYCICSSNPARPTTTLYPMLGRTVDVRIIFTSLAF